jgi:hypothetical protein
VFLHYYATSISLHQIRWSFTQTFPSSCASVPTFENISKDKFSLPFVDFPKINSARIPWL